MLFFIYHVLLFTAGFIQAAPQKVQQSSPQPKPERCNVDLTWDGKQEAVSGKALRGSKIDCTKGFYIPGRWNDPSKNVLASSLFIHWQRHLRRYQSSAARLLHRDWMRESPRCTGRILWHQLSTPWKGGAVRVFSLLEEFSIKADKESLDSIRTHVPAYEGAPVVWAVI